MTDINKPKFILVEEEGQFLEYLVNSFKSNVVEILRPNDIGKAIELCFEHRPNIIISQLQNEKNDLEQLNRVLAEHSFNTHIFLFVNNLVDEKIEKELQKLSAKGIILKYLDSATFKMDIHNESLKMLVLNENSEYINSIILTLETQMNTEIGIYHNDGSVINIGPSNFDENNEDLFQLLSQCLEDGNRDFYHEYCPITIRCLIHLPKLQEDIYIKLRSGRYLKLFREGDGVTMNDLERFRQKGIDTLFLKKQVVKEVLNELNSPLPIVDQSKNKKKS